MGNLDTGSKKVINIYNQAWAEWILQQQQVEVEAELSGEFQFVARATDSLLRVRGKDGRFLALTELQLQYEAEMPDRLAVYAALSRQKYKLNVFVTVIYLLPPPAGVTLTAAFHREFMGQVAHQDFQVIALWELDADRVLAYDNPALLPFVPLMRGGDTEQMLRRCAERICQEPQAAELETVLALFASRVMDINLVKQIVRWNMEEIIKELPLMQEFRDKWIERGREEGRKEGRAKGREEGREDGLEEGERKATLKALRRTLLIRFGAVSNTLDEQLNHLDLATLEQLNEIALTVSDLPAFEAALSEILSPPDNDSPAT